MPSNGLVTRNRNRLRKGPGFAPMVRCGETPWDEVGTTVGRALPARADGLARQVRDALRYPDGRPCVSEEGRPKEAGACQPPEALLPKE